VAGWLAQQTASTANPVTLNPSLTSAAADADGAADKAIEGIESAAAAGPAAIGTAAANAYRAMDGAISLASSAASALPGAQATTVAAAPQNSVGPNAPATANNSSASPITTGSQFIDGVISSLPIVGSVFRLMQGSDAHIGADAVAFAKSGPDAPRPAAPNSAQSDSSKSGGGSPFDPDFPIDPKLPPIVAKLPVEMPALPAIHTVAPDAPPQSSTGAQHGAEAASRAANAASANATFAANSQPSSDARSLPAQKISAEVQTAAASSSSPLASGSEAGSSQSGNSSFGNQNDSQNRAVATNTVNAVPKNAATSADPSTSVPDGIGSTTASATNSSAVASADAIRAAANASVVPVKSQSASDAATAATADPSAVAQAVSAAAQLQNAPAQSANAAAADAKSVTAQLPNPAANTPTAQQNAATLATPANSEMRVAMQTDLLGSIDLRAAVHQSTFSATIGVQREDVQALLANELPALQHALAEKNLQVAQISVLHNSTTGTSSGMHDSRQSPYDPRQHQPRAGSAFTMPYVEQVGSAFEEEARSTLAESWGAAAIAGNAGGVNILV
jgi:flagellar hook-length control protein FliK